jgi:predicted alpha-1,2-mannosidase
MKTRLIIFVSCFSLMARFGYAQSKTSFVDPYIGSGGHGHVFVGANVPFGAVQLGPMNIFKGWDWCSGYNYGDSILTGFSHLRLSGTGIGDLGDVLIMPFTGKIKTDKGTEENHKSGYSSIYSHKNEQVRPGYYAVKLDDYDIDVELTASERVGFHRYKFPKGKQAHIIIDLQEGLNDKSTDTYIEQVDAYTLKGYRFSSGWAKEQQAFFAMRFEKPIDSFMVYEGAKPLGAKKGQGKATKGVISFGPSAGTVQFKVGISPVSSENALDNITAEIPGWRMGDVIKLADDKWNRELSKIDIKTDSKSDKRVFYTALYHSMMHPSLFNDHNGDYQGADNKVHKKPSFNNYSVFSTWDTYRAEHPLFTILNPDKISDFVNTMLAIYDEQGYLPVWHLMGYDTGTMVGVSSQQIIAEAYLKGFRGFDAERAFAAMKKTAMSDLRGLNYVRDFKAIPSNVSFGRPVAHGLENAISDGSIALMARAMGKEADYRYFEKRAKNYQLYYDKQSGFPRGKMPDGSWNPVFDPLRSTKPYATDYAEGNAWQYLWLVPQDVKGLIEMLGGEKIFSRRLDDFFTIPSAGDLVDLTGNIGQYAHGNEPSHHIAYLYAYTGQQWKTAEKVRYIMDNFYHDRPDGIIGNEDCGQMSAWYIFSSLGFYPVFPASGQYVIGSPKFDSASIKLPEGKSFTVTAVNNRPKNIYIQQIELNGKPFGKTFIQHKDIVSGGVMKITMGEKPNYTFGADISQRP